MARRPTQVILLAFFLLIALSAAAPGADTIRVPADQPNIQAALDQAADGDTVLVAPGRYGGAGNRGLDFRGKAVALASEAGPAGTVIDCGGAARGIGFHSGEGSGSSLAGFTFVGGAADNGGGVLCDGASPHISLCILRAGNASQGGGGLACVGGASPAVERCTFTGNSSSVYGAGAYCDGSSPTFTDCSFVAGAALQGGGVYCTGDSRPTLTRCRLSGNAVTDGGGIFCDHSAPTLDACRIEGNLGDAGGGVFCLTASPVLRGCVITGNSVNGNAGGLCALQGSSPLVINCLITGNSADAGGAVSAERPDDAPKLVNCTLSGNRGLSRTGGVNCHNDARPNILNCIVWGNSPDGACGDVASSLLDSDPTVVRLGTFDFDASYTTVVGGKEVLMPDMVVDPGDYRLLPGSPAIDAGASAGAPSFDIDGLPRPCGAKVDIGAYESCDAATTAFRRGDADASGAVDITDAVAVLQWLFAGSASLPCEKSADADDSGAIDVSDAIAILTDLFAGAGSIRPPRECGVDPSPDDLSCGAYAGCR